jgi:hypothetical protein
MGIEESPRNRSLGVKLSILGISSIPLCIAYLVPRFEWIRGVMAFLMELGILGAVYWIGTRWYNALRIGGKVPVSDKPDYFALSASILAGLGIWALLLSLISHQVVRTYWQ